MSTITKSSFGTFADKECSLYTIKNNQGYTLTVSDFGATIISFITPSGYDCIVGDKSLEYFTQESTPHFGATTGRLAGRTKPMTYTINGKEFTLEANEGKTAHLHGGRNSLNKKLWSAQEHQTEDASGIRFTYTSPDGENGYPGTIELQTDILLHNEEPTIIIEYKVTSLSRTPVNLTNHSYFRLEGTTIKDHTITIPALEVYTFDEYGLVNGEKRVENTPWDLRSPTLLENAINNLIDDRQGIDYIWKIVDEAIGRTPISANSLKGKNALTLRHMANLTSPSGYSLDTYSSFPSVVCYTGNYLNTYTTGERSYNSYEAICFETQYCSGYLHNTSLPQSFVSPDSSWHEKTLYKFNFK